MKIVKSLTVGSNLEKTWDFFQDVPEVAKCFPGAKLSEEIEDGKYKGSVLIKLGPFKATFEGEASYKTDTIQKSGKVLGKAIDKKGGSRSRLTLDFKMSGINEKQSRIDFEADIQLAGAIAQFGRIGVIEEAADLIIEEFVKNVEASIVMLATNPTSFRKDINAEVSDSQSAIPRTDVNQSLSLIKIIFGIFKKYFSGHKAQ